MTKVLVWLLFTYFVLKLGSMARARNPGFQRTNMRWRDRLRAREPALFLAACLISVPLALLTSWYSHRTVTGLYAHSTTCYGRLVALKSVPAYRDRFDSVYEIVQGHEGVAFVAAADLDMKPLDVRKALADQVKFFVARYTALQRPDMRQEMLNQIGMAQRCLLPPGAAPKD